MAETSASQQVSLCGLLLRHRTKTLNVGLLIYLALGVALFELLADDRPAPVSKPSRAEGLEHLRRSSALKMWNITNQLNILYEANWTQLVIHELAVFEQNLVDLLLAKRVVSEDGESSQLEWLEESLAEDEDEDEDDDDDNNKSKSKSNSNSNRNSDTNNDQESRPEAKRPAETTAESQRAASRRHTRSRSIKKSLIHSLASLLTIDSPLGRPHLKATQLATIAYGTLGVPLVLLAAAQTGAKLASSSLNGLLVLRHYCFSLPLHYLCCSCGLFSCLRCLLCCCCCCCCPRDRLKKLTRSKGPPRLILRRTKRHRMEEQVAVQAQPRAQSPQAFVIALDQQPDHAPPAGFLLTGQQHQQQPQINHQMAPVEEQAKQTLYSASVAATSVTLLAGYYLAGAYVYSNLQGAGLVESLFACYSILSASKLPLKANTPMQRYKRLRQAAEPKLSPHQLANSSPVPLDQFQTLILESVYLLIGLNLLSTCAHFVRLWLSGEAGELVEKCPSASCNQEQHQFQNHHHSHPAAGDNLDNLAETSTFIQKPSQNIMQGQANQIQLVHSSSPSDNDSQATFQQQLKQAASQQIPSGTDLNLAELFVFGQQAPGQHPPLEIHCNLQQQQQQQHNSDVSFASDKSGERNSLCIHHQNSDSLRHRKTSLGVQNSCFQSGFNQLQQHQICFPPNKSILTNGSSSTLMRNAGLNLIDPTRLKNSSSTSHLCQTNGYGTNGSSIWVNGINGEQDTSTNTTLETPNSGNTMSSSSNRTVRQPTKQVTYRLTDLRPSASLFEAN